MPAGSSPKREHEYEKLKKEFKQEHRYAGREEEVAARIVNKQRSVSGETKDAKASDSRSKHKRANSPRAGAKSHKSSRTSGRNTTRSK